MIKSGILWGREDYCIFLQSTKQEIDCYNEPDEWNGLSGYPCVAIIHEEYDANYCTSHRRGRYEYYTEFVYFDDFLENEDPRLLDYIHEKVREKYESEEE